MAWTTSRKVTSPWPMPTASAMSDSKYISGVTLGNQPPHTMGRSGKRSRTIFATT